MCSAVRIPASITTGTATGSRASSKSKPGRGSAKFRGDLRADEFERLLDDVGQLHSDLIGTVEYATLDGYLWLKLVGNGMGRIEVEGEATESPASGNGLSFRLDLDQTFLPPLISDLEEALREFPVLGKVSPRRRWRKKSI
jgi:hypothetical protein